VSHYAGAEGEREQIPQRHRALRRDGVFQRPVRIVQHRHVRQFWQKLVDWIIEPERAVLDDVAGDDGDRTRDVAGVDVTAQQESSIHKAASLAIGGRGAM
jgi:hypothetical protein